MDGSSTRVRAGTGTLAALTLASVIWGMILVFGGHQAQWGAFGFELVITAAAVFAALFALALLPPHAQGLTLACIAGSILISAGLGLVALGLAPSEVLRHPLFLVRILFVAGFTVLAVLTTLGSSPGAWKQLIRGGLLAISSVGIIAAGFRTTSTWLAGSGTLQVILLVVSLVLLTALAGAFCVGVHLIIRAFETATTTTPTHD